MLAKLVKRKKQQPGPTNATVGVVKPAGLLSRIKKKRIARSVSPLDKPPSKRQLLIDWFRALPLKKKLLTVAVGIVVLTLLIASVSWVLNRSPEDIGDQEKVIASYVCSGRSEDSILYDAADALDSSKPKNFKKLAGVVDKIKKIDNHENDPNCLYPIIRHHVATADRENAKAYYARLEKVYDADRGFDKVYRMDIETVKSMVDHLDTVIKELEANTIYFNGPEEL